MNQTIILNKKIEVLIVSAGGVGTTFLMKAIQQFKTTNCPDNSDGFKHLPIPPLSQNANLKVVYIFGSPIMACLSLFRRNYQVIQSIKAQQYLQKDFTISEGMTLEEYAKNGQDGHYFERHLQNWQEQYRLYPTLFLRYETLFENVEILADFLELPPEFVATFPAKKARKSSFENLTESTKRGLQKMYGDLENEMAALPDFFIKKQEQKMTTALFSAPYQKGLQKWFWKKMPLLRQLKNKLIRA